MEFVTKKEFEDLEKRVAKLESSGLPKRAVQREESIGEFITRKKVKAKSESIQTLCLMYYAEEIRGNLGEGIGSSDLKKLFKETRQKLPKNVSDVLGQCAKKAWIVRSGKKGREQKWKLTNTGVEYVKGLGES